MKVLQLTDRINGIAQTAAILGRIMNKLSGKQNPNSFTRDFQHHFTTMKPLPIGYNSCEESLKNLI